MTTKSDISDDTTYGRTLNTDATSPRLFDCNYLSIEITAEDDVPPRTEEDRLALLSLLAPPPANEDTSSDGYCHKQFQALVRSQQPLLLRHIAAILYECDPACLNFGCNDDEYDPEAISIIYELQNAKGAEDVANIVIQEFQAWLGEDLSPFRANDKFIRMCRSIWMAWCAHDKPHIR